MYYKDYSQFYDNVIKLIIEDVIKNINTVQNQYSKKSCIKLRKNAKNRIFKYYQKERDEIKNYYMSKSVVALDSHKVAACLMFSILKCKPIIINYFIKGLPQDIILANEYIAAYVALNVVDMFRRKSTPEFTTVVPHTYHDDLDSNKSEFIPNLCKALHFIKNLRYFDAFAYANILFMLEKYTDATTN